MGMQRGTVPSTSQRAHSQLQTQATIPSRLEGTSAPAPDCAPTSTCTRTTRRSMPAGSTLRTGGIQGETSSLRLRGLWCWSLQWETSFSLRPTSSSTGPSETSLTLDSGTCAPALTNSGGSGIELKVYTKPALVPKTLYTCNTGACYETTKTHFIYQWPVSSGCTGNAAVAFLNVPLDICFLSPGDLDGKYYKWDTSAKSLTYYGSSSSCLSGSAEALLTNYAVDSDTCTSQSASSASTRYDDKIFSAAVAPSTSASIAAAASSCFDCSTRLNSEGYVCTTTSCPSTSSGSSGGGSNAGLIAGLVIGAIVLIIIAVAIWWCKCRNSAPKGTTNTAPPTKSAGSEQQVVTMGAVGKIDEVQA